MTLSPDVRDALLHAGAAAPSGDNLQPWHARWDDTALHLSIDPDRDRSLYNFRQRPSLIALGAMIENISIAARHLGLRAEIALAPDGPDLLTASMTFSAGASPDPLHAAIADRCTNRRPYRAARLPTGLIESLTHALPPGARAELLFIEDAPSLRVLARAASLNDRVLFECEALHERFFESVRWNAEDAERTGDGLFVKTLELGAMSANFKMMRSWRLARLSNLVGGSVVAPVHSFRTFVRSAAFGYLQMTGDSREDFVEGGRLIERVWLTATSLGLSFQPMAGMLYLLNYLRTPTASIGTGSRRVLERADGLFRRILPFADSKGAIMLFRVGYGPPPTARSVRRPLPGQETV